MTGFAIRAFREGDGAALMGVHTRAILATPEAFYTPEQKQSWAYGLEPGFYQPGDGLFEVAVREDDVPFAFCHTMDEDILGLYIDPAHQRQGIGSALLARGEAWIGARGSDTASVKATLAAEAFYRHHGYALVTMSEHKTRGGLFLPCVILQKRLAN